METQNGEELAVQIPGAKRIVVNGGNGPYRVILEEF